MGWFLYGKYLRHEKVELQFLKYDFCKEKNRKQYDQVRKRRFRKYDQIKLIAMIISKKSFIREFCHGLFLLKPI